MSPIVSSASHGSSTTAARGSLGQDGHRILPTLVDMPSEILELIAFHCASNASVTSGKSMATSSSHPIDESPHCSPCNHQVASPLPHSLCNLVQTNRRMYSLLSASRNQRLYSRIFQTKFDTDAILRRFGPKAVSPQVLTTELKKRCTILKRVRRAVSMARLYPDGFDAQGRSEMEENLWLGFMMMMENDGLNIEQLHWARMEDYLRLHHSQDMLEAAFRPEYPQNSPDRALALQLNYLITDPDRISSESQDESDEKLFVLRPFVFAAHRFDSYFAEWTTRRVPHGDILANTDSMHVDSHAPSSGGAGRPEPRTIIHCGQEITICPPNSTQAACFNFFMKVERDPAVTGLSDIEPADIQETMLGRLREGSADQSSSRNPLSFTSANHDRDLVRLLSCTSPARSPGLRTFYHLGQFEGSWEGRFTYFDFDSYRDMLGGKLRSLYEGHFGEQPQVWKVKEHLTRLRPGEYPGGMGDLLNAGYYPENDEPTDRENLTLEDARAFVRNRQEAKNGSRTLPPDWHLYPTFEDEDNNGVASSGGDDDDENRYEILLSGTGHSAWGRFLLRGRVRSWDGMLTMAKEYRPDGRGRWLYRGYVVAGNRLVGRWRDTFTPVQMSGYEGCFLLHRRGQ